MQSFLKRQLYRAMFSNGDVRRQANFVSVRGVVQIGVRLAIVQYAIHKVLDFSFERMVRNVTAVGEDGGHRRPTLLPGPPLREDLIIADGSLIAEEFHIEDVRLNALDG